MRSAIVKKSSLAEPRKRGSQPGVARGPYKPRALNLPEPTAEELARWCLDYWGRETYDAGTLVVHHRTSKLVSVRRYLPPDSMFSPDHPSRSPTVPTGWKKCRGCGDELELHDFGPNGRGGYKAHCKDCLAEKARIYASTPKGKAARARALAKYEAQGKAQDRLEKDRAEFYQAASRTPGGRKFLAMLGRAPMANKDVNHG